jgi:hypothetical protein
MDMILLPGGILRASVWDPNTRDSAMRDVSEDLPFFLRNFVKLHEGVTLRDILLLAENHRDFLMPLFTDLLDEFIDEVKRPVGGEHLCDLDYLEIRWECFASTKRFDMQPVLVGRKHRDPAVYSVEAVPTNSMGHLPVHQEGRFLLELEDEEEEGARSERGARGAGGARRKSESREGRGEGEAAHERAGHGEDEAPHERAGTIRRELRRDFMLYDIFDAVLAEITYHGDPGERDTWWQEKGRRQARLDDSGGEDEGS